MRYVIEGAKRKNGYYVLPLGDKLNAIIKEVMSSKPYLEIEITQEGAFKIAAPSHLLKDRKKLIAAAKHDKLLKLAKQVSKKLIVEAKRQPPNRLKIDVLRKQLEELKQLLDRYRKICENHVVFVNKKYLESVAPVKEDFSVLSNPDFLQLVFYILTTK